MKINLKSTIGIIAILILPVALCAQDSLQVNILNEAIVTASRMQLPLKNIPQKVEIVNQSTIEKTPNKNLGEVLKNSLNLDVIEYPGASTTVSLRGFPNTSNTRGYTPILVDGVPAGTINLSVIPVDFIERVEVIKGPYSVLYGADAMGGVINIITKKCSPITTGNFNIGIGDFGKTQYSGYISSSISSKLLFSMGYSRFQQSNNYRIGSNNLLKISEIDKLILDEKSYGDIMSNTKYSISQFSGKLEYLISSKWSAGIYTSYTSSNDIELPGNYWHTYGLKKSDISRMASYVQVKYATADNELLISPYLTTYKDDTYDNNDMAFKESKQKIVQSGVKVGNTHQWGNFKWLVGADFDDVFVGSENFSDKITQIAPFVPDNSRRSLSGFTQLAYIHNNLSANIGARYSYITYSIEESLFLSSEKKSEDYSNFSPSLGIKYNITNNLSVHGSVGSAFYVPDAYKVAGYYTTAWGQFKGNKDLKPETSTSFDLGASYNSGEYITADLTYFHNYFKNRIIEDYDDSSYITFKNAQRGTMSGLELMLTSNLARLWTSEYRLELYGEVTCFIDNSLKDSIFNSLGVKVEVAKDALYTRKAAANFGVAFNNKGFESRLNCRYIGHRLEQDWMTDFMTGTSLRPNIKPNDYYTKGGFTEIDKILRHPEHLILDFSSYYTFKKFRIGITISNLWDENYTEKDGYNMPGRSIMGHFNFKF